MKIASALVTAYRVVSHHGFADVLENEGTGQKSFHALASFYPGDVICPFGSRETMSKPTYLTVQTGIDRHILLEPEFLQYINHSCNPNVFFDTTSLQLICLKEMHAGDEMSFFYPSTEWEMTQPFNCYCESEKCLHHIQGAKHIPEEIIFQYRLTDFIRQQILKRLR